MIKRFISKAHGNDALGQSDVVELQECRSKFDALSRMQATVEFELEGTIITANQNFLDTVMYSLEEIVGQHHRLN
ncbi:MAG: hypothetical protein AB8B55_14295 [Mariniblastus sp.]